MPIEDIIRVQNLVAPAFTSKIKVHEGDDFSENGKPYNDRSTLFCTKTLKLSVIKMFSNLAAQAWPAINCDQTQFDCSVFAKHIIISTGKTEIFKISNTREEKVNLAMAERGIL